jgi:hypothetical protein
MSSLVAVATCIVIRHVIFISNQTVKHLHMGYFIRPHLTLGDSDTVQLKSASHLRHKIRLPIRLPIQQHQPANLS